MKQEELQLTGGGKKENRRELDFYPTPPDATKALMKFLIANVDQFDEEIKVWEPACGTGEMSKVIESFGYTVISSDVRETGYGTGNIDFLNNLNFTEADAIITNPPFNLSHLFIEKACEKADIVCMLLKSQYWHAKKRIELFNNTKPSYVLPLTWRPDFLNGERGGAPTMDVAWTVWSKGSMHCIYQPLSK